MSNYNKYSHMSLRSTHVNFSKLPESDTKEGHYIKDSAKSVRSAYVDLPKLQETNTKPPNYNHNSHLLKLREPNKKAKVVDSRSCRQIYLRSYPFSRKQSVPEKTKKCLRKITQKIKNMRRRSRKRPKSEKVFSCEAFLSIFTRLIFTTKVDVGDHGDGVNTS